MARTSKPMTRRTLPSAERAGEARRYSEFATTGSWAIHHILARAADAGTLGTSRLMSAAARVELDKVLRAPTPLLTCANALIHTLKRNESGRFRH